LTADRPTQILYISPVSGSFVRLGGTCYLYPHLVAGASCTLSFAFDPQSDGPQLGAIRIHWRPEGFPAVVDVDTLTPATIIGTGIPPGDDTAIADLAYYTTTSDTEAPHIHAGERVAFVATVKPAAGTVLITGAVLFYDGITAIGTAELYSNDAISYATLFSTMTTGAHVITAVYSGNTTFGAAFSEPLQIVVQ